MIPQRLRTSRATLLLAAAVLLTFAGCGTVDDGWPADSDKLKVVTSFAPLYSFATNVAGEDAIVRNLLSTSGPHHFNPTDKDARLLRRADLFFVNGLGLEGDKPGKMATGSGNKNLKIVELGAAIPENMLLEGSCNHDHGDGDHGHAHDGEGKDPHLWLSPEYAVLMVQAIRDELKAADPAHAEGYERRAAEYIAKLRKLKDEGDALFKEKTDRRLITFHDSMTYFAKTFGLDIVGVVQKYPGAEPGDKQLKELTARCAGVTPPVRVICAEPQYANSNAGTELVKILKAKGVPDPVLVELDTLETVPAEQLNAEWYEARMRANLQALSGAMK